MAHERSLVLLDGPLGTQLEARGVPTPLPLWSAAAVKDAPDVVRAVHADYAAAGADVHTAATFRTTARALAQAGCDLAWEVLAQRAVSLCREGAGADGKVAGCIAPLEDCWHPERTPDAATLASEHGDLARCLADSGADLLLVETMPSIDEMAAATRAAVATGLPVWTAITLGPTGDFFTSDEVRQAAAVAAAEGAEAFLLNCTPADAISPLLDALADWTERPLLLGAYGNALFEGHDAWTPDDYAREVTRWIDAGATLVGGCCGTGLAHLEALRRLVDARA
jgi:S-methylmethionine-dependent homocysteine/selenocysteine methylase